MSYSHGTGELWRASFAGDTVPVITIPGIWKNPGAVYPIFRDIHIPGLFDDLVITNSGMMKKLGMYFMLISGLNSLMLHCI